MKRWLKFSLVTAVLLVAILALNGQPVGKYLGFTADRYWDNNGVIKTDARIETTGASNALRLAYSGGVYTDITENSAGAIYINQIQDGENDRILYLNSAIAGTVESRQGMLYIYGSRPLGYATSSWGGSPDMAMKVHIRNYAINGVAGGAMRAAEFMASQRNTGTTCDMWGGLFNAESLSGTSTHGIYGLQVCYDQSGNVNTEHAGLWVQDNSQSNVGTNYGIKLYTATYAQTREHGLWIGSQGGSWTNGISFYDAITFAFNFENLDETNAAGYNAAYSTPAAYAVPDGFITVNIGGTTQYIYTFTAKPAL